ncbi:hypothetical protein LCGC14_0552070 [marine sediment metagenome]|uniref:Uncharacterized protein n=1 Tax=marine sediment metagenome TaxID=412755 RepID=A0A0F9RUI0_9ZZZZ
MDNELDACVTCNRALRFCICAPSNVCGSNMTRIKGEHKRRVIAAITEARKQRDLCNGSVWDNLLRILGRRDADIAMMNLMWADRSFMPTKQGRS